MNTITVQLNDRQYQDLDELLGHAGDQLDRLIENETDEDNLADWVRLKTGAIPLIVEALASTKRYLWSDSYGFNDLEVPAEVVDAVAQSGDNEPACRAAIEEHGFLRRQLEELDMERARTYLSEAGIDQVEKKDDAEVRLYMLRMACHDISEERHQED